MTTKTVKPSSSYSLKLPEEVRESFEGTVSSFWIEGSPLLLQLSSYIRSEGKQLEAEHRLRERIAKDPGDWRVWSNKLVVLQSNKLPESARMKLVWFGCIPTSFGHT
jgi:hypothetical protein